ncbi:ABC transporter permease [Pseudarthrobacter sp. SL88]|uniref:ABC transporter permease n=1 Tax=Pseudarthrobacter sp. SL88 TaxID=2994666 RepID=UPI002273FFBF|nr:ABC transporter permease [Pseudarthrobacter sp. SL88]MCY1674888.1 ABC transporter permease [Pseudarthrobacter sp. SL88]
MSADLNFARLRSAGTATLRTRAGIPPTVLVSFLVILVVVLWSLLPSLFTGYSPVNGDTGSKLDPPSLQHWFGTDYLGRDQYARVVYGTASSVTSALVAVAIGLLVGSAIGLASGFRGGWLDATLGRFVDVLLAIPGFLLAVVIVSSLGFQTINAAIATGVSAVAVFARLMRAEVIRVRRSAFVEASYLEGGNRLQALLTHVLPNAYRSVLVLAVLQFGTSILVIASLAFLGYGDPPPSSDWGLLVASGKTYVTAPWLVYAPALVIVATVLSINRISRWLRNSK